MSRKGFEVSKDRTLIQSHVRLGFVVLNKPLLYGRCRLPLKRKICCTEKSVTINKRKIDCLTWYFCNNSKQERYIIIYF